jgi:hypothetical protein
MNKLPLHPILSNSKEDGVSGLMTWNVPLILQKILWWIHYNAMKTFLARPDHFRMSTAGFDLVDWDAIDLAMAGFPEMFRLWASKHRSHFCGVGRMQFTCRFWDHSWCPQQCQQDNETTDEHIILCNGQGTNQEWTSQVTNRGVWLIEMDTHPSICHFISESLMQRSPLTSFISHSDLVCHSATLEQDGIGWQNFVEG